MTTKGEILYYLAINSTENSTTLWNYRQRECAFWTEYLPQVIGYITPTYPPTTEVCGGNFAGGKKVFLGGNEPKLFLGSRRTPFLCPSGKKTKFWGSLSLAPSRACSLFLICPWDLQSEFEIGQGSDNEGEMTPIFSSSSFQFWWEPDSPLQIAFWSMSSFCLLFAVITVIACLLWRNALR